MSILDGLMRNASSFEIYSCDKEEGGLFQIHVSVAIPVAAISDDTWYGLDDEFVDPVTESIYSGLDFDLDHSNRHGRFMITLNGGDRKIAARHLIKQLELETA